jgi:hypothetical protein
MGIDKENEGEQKLQRAWRELEKNWTRGTMAIIQSVWRAKRKKIDEKCSLFEQNLG